METFKFDNLETIGQGSYGQVSAGEIARLGREGPATEMAACKYYPWLDGLHGDQLDHEMRRLAALGGHAIAMRDRLRALPSIGQQVIEPYQQANLLLPGRHETEITNGIVMPYLPFALANDDQKEAMLRSKRADDSLITVGACLRIENALGARFDIQQKTREKITRCFAALRAEDFEQISETLLFAAQAAGQSSIMVASDSFLLTLDSQGRTQPQLTLADFDNVRTEVPPLAAAFSDSPDHLRAQLWLMKYASLLDRHNPSPEQIVLANVRDALTTLFQIQQNINEADAASSAAAQDILRREDAIWQPRIHAGMEGMNKRQEAYFAEIQVAQAS